VGLTSSASPARNGFDTQAMNRSARRYAVNEEHGVVRQISTHLTATVIEGVVGPGITARPPFWRAGIGYRLEAHLSVILNFYFIF
jgi:hypothetical protein